MTERYTDQFFDSWSPNLPEAYFNDYTYDNLSCLTVTALYENEQACFTKNNENNTLLLDIGSKKYKSSLKENNNEKQNIKQIFLNNDVFFNDDTNLIHNQIPKISSVLQCQTRTNLSLNVSNFSTLINETTSDTQSNIVLLNNNKNNEWHENCLNYVKIPCECCVSESNGLLLSKQNSKYQKLNNLEDNTFNKNTTSVSINLNTIKSFEKDSIFFTNNILKHKSVPKASQNIYYNNFDKELIDEKKDTFEFNVIKNNNFSITKKASNKSFLTGKVIKNKKLLKSNNNFNRDLKREKDNLILIKNLNKFPKKRLCFTKDQTLRLKFFLFSNILVS